MKSGANAVVLVGTLSLVVGIVSRLMKQPVAGIESHAIVDFAQACFLLAIALALVASQSKS